MLNKTQLLPDRPGIPPMAPLPEPEVIDPAVLAAAYATGEPPPAKPAMQCSWRKP